MNTDKNQNSTIRIIEVGPRDGLQNEKLIVSARDKAKFIHLLEIAGHKHIETTSFVKPGAIPQLADATEVSQLIGVGKEHICLVANDRGYHNAVAAGYRKIAVFTSPSDAFNQKNINKTTEQSKKTIAEILKKARNDGIQARGYISTVVACPYEGPVAPVRVRDLAEFLLAEGVYEVSLGETIGVAVPFAIEKLLTTLFGSFSPQIFAAHFHDTYGTALANVAKAIEMGITSIDSSAGGLGGCPYAPGAAGNLATEDLLYFLEHSGFSTTIDLYASLEATRFIFSCLGREPSSRVFSAYHCQKR